jgi:hypothetical protein
VFVPVAFSTLAASNGYVRRFRVDAFEGTTGGRKYTLTNDYITPSGFAGMPYQPVISPLTSGTRLYYAGAGGTVYYVDSADSETPSAPTQLCFYTDLKSYASNSGSYNSSVFIVTPLTADTNGVVFFGFRVLGSAPPAPLNTQTNGGGYARVDPAGDSIYVLANEAAGDVYTSVVPQGCAPALSSDTATLYAVVQGFSSRLSHILGLDSTTLATKYSAPLLNPLNGGVVQVGGGSTASPMVGPDGDVFYGVLGNGNRGFLLHFSADLATVKLPGDFGWDHTAAIVPTSMVPSYTGPSPYLLFSKYNDYSGALNRIALLDPDVPQNANGLNEMREVMTVNSCTPVYAGPPVVEWCINTAAVNPATSSIFAPNEDGLLYRWNLVANSMTEAFALRGGVAEPYVPTVVGSDGTVYTIFASTLYALGQPTNMEITVSSSAPDSTTVVVGQPVTFTATVTNLNPLYPPPTGAVTFQDRSYQGSPTPVTNTLAADVPLTNGQAAVTTSGLSGYLGSHFVTAFYSGDATFPSSSATLIQKVHSYATTTTVTSSVPAPGSNSVTFTAVVAPLTPTNSNPTGMVSFWDRSNFLAQAGLVSTGWVSVAVTNLAAGSHAVRASYYSDPNFAASSGSVLGTPPTLTALRVLSDGSFQLAFTNVSGAPFTVLGSTNLLTPVTNWAVLGPAVEIVPSQFQFTDPQVLNSYGARFYCVRSP